MSIDIVLYHANCRDGFCAAWLLHNVYPGAEYIPVQYGESPVAVNGKNVIIADFSYPRAILLDMLDVAESLLVFDHHKTAQADLADLSFCKFDMSKSGGRLIQEYLDGPDNWLVNYTEDRDLWLWRLPMSKELNAGLQSYPMDFRLWNGMFEESVKWQDRLISEGTTLLRAESNAVDSVIKKARIITIQGYVVPAVHTTVLFSEIAGKLAEDASFGVTWFVRDKLIQFSLRSRKCGVDVSQIAKKYGGGGHAAAAGFEMPLLDGLKLLELTE